MGKEVEPGDLLVHSDAYRGYLSTYVVTEVVQGKAGEFLRAIYNPQQDAAGEYQLAGRKPTRLRSADRTVVAEKNVVDIDEVILL
tara:strand:- start:2127 stop:2381 length:255 start_codon:yes stop_codon:yes gene_type:complete